MTVDLGAVALAGLALASVAAAVLMLLGLRRWSDQEALGRAKAHAQAHLLEFRLLMDDPIAILRSQRALFADNFRILRLLAKPLLLLSIPMALLLWQLDAFYGRAPLQTGRPAIVSFAGQADRMQAPDGVAIETGPVHIRATGETCWRIRPERDTAGALTAASAEARIVAGDGISYLPRPLFESHRLEIAYPRATVFGFHWLLWFMLISTIAAFALRRRLRVVF